MTNKVIFFGSSDYCLPVLETLNKNFNLAVVITKPDKPVGRKYAFTPSPPKQFALSHNIEVFTPHDGKELTLLNNELIKYAPDIALVADYGLIIPKDIYTLPRCHTVNIHFSKLPKYRGPSPVQYTILNGDTNAWISFLLIAENLDAGDILSQIEVPLKGDETSKQLYTILFEIAHTNLPEILNKYINSKLTPMKQDHAKATYTKIFAKDDGFIPFEVLKLATQGEKSTEAQFHNLPFYNNFSICKPPAGGQFSMNFQLAIFIERMIRAFSPWPGVWTILPMKQCNNETMNQINLKRLKILKGHREQRTDNLPAQAGRKQITRLVLDLVQLEGKNPVSWKQFLEGYPEIFY